MCIRDSPYFAQMRGLFERAQAAQGGNVSLEYLSMGIDVYKRQV